MMKEERSSTAPHTQTQRHTGSRTTSCIVHSFVGHGRTVSHGDYSSILQQTKHERLLRESSECVVLWTCFPLRQALCPPVAAAPPLLLHACVGSKNVRCRGLVA